MPTQVLAQGYSVGRVEEMPAAPNRVGGGSSKLLVRQLVRIYTPGTAVEGLLLDDQVRNGHALQHSRAEQRTAGGVGRTRAFLPVVVHRGEMMSMNCGTSVTLVPITTLFSLRVLHHPKY